MKTKTVLLFILFSNFLLAQNPVSRMFFLDSLGNETEEGKHKYYRIIKDYFTVKPLHEFTDYYQNDTIQMKGHTSSVDRIIEDGRFIYYYENGKRKKVANYNDGRLIGKEFKWYENGNKKSDGEYILADDKQEASIFLVNQYWDKDGQQKVIDGNGDFEDSDGSSVASGKVVNGQKIGEWKGEDKKTKITFIENYNNGKLVSGISTDSLNVQHTYDKILIKPKPKKGFEHFYHYIGTHFTYSRESEGKSGKIFILFYIEKDGRASDFKIIRGLGFGLDEEAIRLISSYNEWESGSYRGIKTRFSFTLPISIQSPN